MVDLTLGENGKITVASITMMADRVYGGKLRQIPTGWAIIPVGSKDSGKPEV